MNFTKYFFTALILVLTLLSCATVESVKSPDFNSKIYDLYVMINPGAGFRNFGASCKRAMTDKLAASGINAEVILITGLELDTESFKQSIAQHSYLLTINLTAATVSGDIFHNQLSGVYDLKLYDIAKDKMVWRATIKIDGMAYGSGPTNLVNKTIEAFVKDGLIDPPPKSPSKT